MRRHLGERSGTPASGGQARLDGCGTGIEGVGALPWGSHLCHFFGSEEDYLQALVPYLREGLQQGDACIWVTASPVPVALAREALAAAVPDLDVHEGAGQIEIVDARDWYLRTGAFDPADTLRRWLAREAQARAQGRGLRVAANVSWLERAGFDAFIAYEEELTRALQGRRAAILCSYSLVGCHAHAVLDVTHAHDFALARRRGVWEGVAAVSLPRAG